MLDGLRGVAAVIVVLFHITEFHYTDPQSRQFNHGYLAVDFFFLLSGFVIGYAYDDRWNGMTPWTFLKRRLIRLHPMVIVGSLLGAALFYFSASKLFPIVGGTPVPRLLIMTLLGALLIPVPPSADVRGWGEIFPVNAPSWSLFFEYIANILYALGLRRLGIKPLGILTAVFAAALIHLSVNMADGMLIGGWTMSGDQFRIGMTRLLFPFFGGLFLFRLGRLIRIKHAFPVAAVLLVAVLLAPRIGDASTNWMNGFYESLVIILVFPLIVMIGAGGSAGSRTGGKVCDFLGEISYPLYLVHYPIFYVYFGWAHDKGLTLSASWPYALLAIVISIATAYGALRLLDAPIRKRLTRFAR
ncbi:MAG: acyltransferase [Luteolibacter sp.]